MGALSRHHVGIPPRATLNQEYSNTSLHATTGLPCRTLAGFSLPRRRSGNGGSFSAGLGQFLSPPPGRPLRVPQRNDGAAAHTSPRSCARWFTSRGHDPTCRPPTKKSRTQSESSKQYGTRARSVPDPKSCGKPECGYRKSRSPEPRGTRVGTDSGPPRRPLRRVREAFLRDHDVARPYLTTRRTRSAGRWPCCDAPTGTDTSRLTRTTRANIRLRIFPTQVHQRTRAPLRPPLRPLPPRYSYLTASTGCSAAACAAG